MRIDELGLALIMIGVGVIVLAAVIISVKSSRKGNVKAAGVIMMGPVPIIFGTDKETAKTVLALAIILTALAIVLMLVHNFLWG
ncbi:MAG: TIGR00304 family membrane protein [Candidatus Bathyarchaeia archaeon]|jgi:uncharacterized protein (TIGR00304 family)